MTVIVDQDALDTVDDAERAVSLAQAKLKLRASQLRSEMCSFVEVPPQANRSQVLAAICNHSLFKNMKPEFTVSHVLIIIDPANGPETMNPTRQPPSKTTLVSYRWTLD